MTTTTQYLPFGTAGGANTLSAAAYAATAVRGTGYVAGLADAQHINTALRQASVGVAGLAKFATDYGSLDCLDDGSPTNFATAVKSAIDALLQVVAPTGLLMAFAASTAPTGWLEANGAAVSRTTYAALFAVIGTTYGTGDGSTTFNLPDARGRVFRGWDHGAGRDPGRAFGSAQDDAMQNVTGTLGAIHGGSFSNTGPFLANGTPLNHIDAPTTGTDPSWTFDLSRAARTAAETRVKSLAILVCVKF